jgi:hypothetical protein
MARLSVAQRGQTFADRIPGQVRNAEELKLRHDSSPMGFDGFVAERQLQRDFLCGSPASQQRKHFTFTRGKTKKRAILAVDMPLSPSIPIPVPVLANEFKNISGGPLPHFIGFPPKSVAVTVTIAMMTCGRPHIFSRNHLFLF